MSGQRSRRVCCQQRRGDEEARAGLGKDELSGMGGARGESGVSEGHVCERQPGAVCKGPMNKTLDESRLDVVSLRKRAICLKPAAVSAEVRSQVLKPALPSQDV